MVVGISNTNVIPKSYRGLQVLLVGNDKNCMMYMKSTLEDYSYKVTCVESAAVALLMVGEEEESKFFDFVIADMDLKELDDFRFFNHIILNTELPLVLMSCDVNNDAMRKALNQAACFFIRKPICAQILANVWQHVLKVRRMQTMHDTNGQGTQILLENDIWEGNNMGINEEPQVQDNIHTIDALNLSKEESGLVTNQEKEACQRKIVEEDDDDMEDEKSNKKPRFSWTDELRFKFEKAIQILGEEKARPKEILRLMGVPDVTLRHVSSHLQKHREKMRRAGINCATSQPHKSKLINMGSGMKRQNQNEKPWDLLDTLNNKILPVTGMMIQPTTQCVPQQHNTESISVHYKIDIVKKLLDNAKNKKANNYDNIQGNMKGGYYKELTVERSSMHGSNPNECDEANIFRHKGFSENASAMILNPDSAAASELYVPGFYEDHLASNDCSNILNHLSMDISFITSEQNGSGMLEDIIFSSQGL